MRATFATRCSATRGAARVFGPQKGADPAAVAELEARLASLAELEPFRDLAGAGAGGGLGAAFAALGGELVAGAELVLDLIGFDAACGGAALVVTGEGTVDATTLEGKAPGAVRATLPGGGRSLRAVRRHRARRDRRASTLGSAGRGGATTSSSSARS